MNRWLITKETDVVDINNLRDVEYVVDADYLDITDNGYAVFSNRLSEADCYGFGYPTTEVVYVIAKNAFKSIKKV